MMICGALSITRSSSGLNNLCKISKITDYIMLSELQKEFKFVFIQFANGNDKSDQMIMATQGAQYIFRVRRFDCAEELRHALATTDKDERQNLMVLPEHHAWLELLGNMQHVPMERLNPDDVYKDIQEVKQEAAEWYGDLLSKEPDLPF